ncbi:GNAT family N-acetyltransferase [Terricaulis sp.]|uniref:GNAT family N-acetyltransferase n=1 Tax=Terricaulis sp. TaxID=2768686 RepID=UPI003784F29A
MDRSVELTRATADDRDPITRLMQFYIYDFTELMAPEKAPQISERGDFGAYPGLDAYWREPTHSAWSIRVGGKRAGFALLNKNGHLGRSVDHNMAEFFIARPFRRRGAARDAFHQLLRLHPGQWELAISAYNKPAQVFWPRAIEAAGAADVETVEGDGVTWTGPVLRFRA